MKKLLFIFLLVSQIVVAQSKVTTLYFIRHAEKIDNSQNPDLSDLGKARAENWKAIFEFIPFDAVYTTDFKRTLQTALPTANSKNVIPIIYSPKNIDFTQFIKENFGKTILIVGHSNSTPEFVNKIIKEKKYEAIAETVFGNLYIVTILENDIVKHQLLKLN